MPSQEYDSSDRIPAVHGTAASVPGSEAMVGCVHRLPLCGHAHDRCVWMHSAGNILILLLKPQTKITIILFF